MISPIKIHNSTEQKLSLVALIGSANVGKSTFFNRLTKNRTASLATNIPNCTRDRIYGCDTREKKIIYIDTPSLENKNDMFSSSASRQSYLAISEANIILFIVDATFGIKEQDYSILKYLYSHKKNIFLVVNKVDRIDFNQATTNFLSLGLRKVYYISALYNRGIKSLVKSISSSRINICRKSIPHIHHLISNKNPIKIAIAGYPNSGKSTLINTLLKEERVAAFQHPGTTRDQIHTSFRKNHQDYILIDTAGVRKFPKVKDRIESLSILKTIQCIKDADITFLVIDFYRGISSQDHNLINFIKKKGRCLLILINKCDHHDFNTRIKKNIKNLLERANYTKFTYVHFISALKDKNLNKVFCSVKKICFDSKRRFSTNTLTRIMYKGLENHSPPIVCGKRIRLKYAHSGGYNPTTIIVHGNKVNDLPNSYKSYLLNYFRDSLNIYGIFIRLIFKENKNPFLPKNVISSR